MTITVFLVDDHPMILQGLRDLLTDEPDFRVIGEAGDGLEALAKIELTKPDVVVMDMMMPSLNGIGLLLRLKKILPATRTIVFSMQSAIPYVIEALRAGANGYVLKSTGPAEMVEAINSVMRGEQFLSRHFDHLEVQVANIADVEVDLYKTLTMRELEILQLTAEGRSSTEIGKELRISPRTVEVHRGHLMKKLGLRNQTELIRFSIKRGILPMDE